MNGISQECAPPCQATLAGPRRVILTAVSPYPPRIIGMSMVYPGPILAAGLLLAALLAGCGQKGPLYLPAPPAPPTSAEPSQPPKL